MIVELTLLHEQAIEAVLWVLFGHGAGRDLIQPPDGEGMFVHESAVLLAAMFVDRLEAVNDTTLAGIVEAAQISMCVNEPPCIITESGHAPFPVTEFFAALAVEGVAKGKNPLPCPTCDAMTDEDCGASDCPRSFERVDVPSWFTDHARFPLGPLTHYADCSSRSRSMIEGGRPACNCGASSGREFVIPPIRIGGAE